MMSGATDAEDGIVAATRKILASQAPILKVSAAKSGVIVRRRIEIRDSTCSYAGKRMADVVLSVILLAFVFPLLVLVWCAVRLDSPGPGLFRTVRVGRNGRLFVMPKFRTMATSSPLAPRESLGADAEPFISPLGRLLRRSSIDELPQLWSILRGDMSFIGPRPLLPDDAAAIVRQSFPASLRATPGISGLSQVRGRNYVTPRRKARYDSFYAKHVGWRMDLFIAWSTLVAILSNDGVM
jgi:O-antigen biosynthesis protein WbqP